MREQIIAVQKMQDFIKTKYLEEISLMDLAKVSNYSPWHSYRLFREYLGITPFEYLRKYRLSKSALQLKNKKTKILDIALNNGFNSADGYTRAFYKEFKMTPIEYARKPVLITLFIPYRLQNTSERKEKVDVENVKNVFIQIIEKPRRKAIIKRGIKAVEYFEYCGEVGCDVWATLVSMDSLAGEPVCMWLPKSLVKPGTSVYVQGVEVEEKYDGIIPDGFDVIDLPAATYLMFQGEMFNEEDYQEAIEILKNAIDKYNINSIGYEWDDNTSPRIQLEPRSERGYIELRAIKKIK